MSDESPTLEQVLAAKLGGAANFLVQLPARVVAYYEAEQAVDAEIVILEYVEQEGGGRKAVPRPVVIKAPVVFHRAGTSGVTLPISEGDVVMLHFQSANLSRWLAVGGLSEPQDDRKHALCSAVAYPGGHSFVGTTAPKTTAPQDAVVVHRGHGKMLRLGGPDADDPVVRMSDLQQVLNYAIAVNNRLTAHTHTVATTGSASAQTGTAAATSATSPSTPSPDGSAVVFSE